MVLCCEFPLFSLSFIQQLFSLWLSFLLFGHLVMPQAPNSSNPWFFFFFFLNARTGWKGGEMARLYLNPESQSASCIIMRNDISIHTRLLLSLCTFVLPARRNTFVPSARWYGPLHCFPHTSSFIPLLPQNIHTMPPFFLVSHPSFLSMLEYPVFHSAAQWAVWMCLVSYITSFLELLPPARCHCITYPLLCATQWGSFFLCLFEAQIWSPNGDGIKLGAESQTSPPPQTQVIPWIAVT